MELQKQRHLAPITIRPAQLRDYLLVSTPCFEISIAWNAYAE